MPKPANHVSKRRRWNESEARAALEALARSGLSIRPFALREGIKYERLVRWRSRFKKAVPGSAPAPVAFVEVRDHKPKGVEARREQPDRIEVVLRSGRVLRCAEEIDAGALRRLVDVLEQDPSC